MWGLRGGRKDDLVTTGPRAVDEGDYSLRNVDTGEELVIAHAGGPGLDAMYSKEEREMMDELVRDEGAAEGGGAPIAPVWATPPAVWEDPIRVVAIVTASGSAVADKMYTTFGIVVTRVDSEGCGQRWTVFRRYSAFRTILESLRSAGFRLPTDFPKRHIVGLFKSEIVSTRRTGLRTWLRELLVGTPEVLAHAPFWDFLTHDANREPARYAGPGQAELGDAADKILRRKIGDWGYLANAAMRAHGWSSHPGAAAPGGARVAGAPTPTSPAARRRPAPPPKSGPAPAARAGSGALEGGKGAAGGGSSGALSGGGDRKKISLEDFELLKVIGKGSFGKVLQVRKRDTGKVYAMKILSKPNIVARKQVEHTKTERRVLGYTKFPFVVSLHYAFQTRDKLFFILDFASGGELFYHLGRLGKFPEEMARFYTAELTLALGHLHSKGVVYRDLKPENILFDADGHVKLADFGLSKEGVHAGAEGAKSFCGTPEYLAPEVLDKVGHGTAVDWWSLGMIVFEMLTGLPPWYTKDRKKLYDRIRRAELRFPSDVPISAHAKDIIRRFLIRDPRERLGGGGGGASDVMAHPWFASIDFAQLGRRRITPPFVPRVRGAGDTSNFESEFTRLPADITMEGKGIDKSYERGSRRERLSSSVAPHFPGFTFEGTSALAGSSPGHSLGSGGLPFPRRGSARSLRRKSPRSLPDSAGTPEEDLPGSPAPLGDPRGTPHGGVVSPTLSPTLSPALRGMGPHGPSSLGGGPARLPH